MNHTSPMQTLLAIGAAGLVASVPLSVIRASEAEAIPQSADRLVAQAQSRDVPAVGSAEQDALPESRDPRFAFYRIDDVFVRLDRHTGAVASCGRQTGEWACMAAADERAALDQTIARLQRDNAVLKQALLDRGLPLPDGTAGSASAAAPAAEAAPSGGALVPRPPQSVPPAASPVPASPPNSGELDQAARLEAEVDRVMNIVENVWRRVVHMAKKAALPNLGRAD